MSDIKLIMERIAPGRSPRSFKLWACRGEGRGCDRNRYRNQKKHCDDCVETQETETLADLKKRLERGDA